MSLLTITLALPFLGFLAVLLTPRGSKASFIVAFFTTIATFSGFTGPDRPCAYQPSSVHIRHQRDVD